MATAAEVIILQPLWKIHNIDWSDRRNVFETDPSSPNLHLLRRKHINLSQYFQDVTRHQVQPCSSHYDKIDNQGDNGKQQFLKY